jgi:ribosomal protein L16 Arg81 hydroxylase
MNELMPSKPDPNDDEPHVIVDAPAFDVRRLIHPIDPETFKRDYWEKRHLVVRRNRPDYYAGLLSLADVDHILSLSSIRGPQVRALRDGKEISLDRLVMGWMVGNAGVLESLYAEYQRGCTIVLQFLQEHWEPLRRLSWALAAEFSAFFQVNAYLTPAKSKGLNTHYDTHDVFVLQTGGSKRWRLYEGPTRLPLKAQPYVAETMKPGPLLEEVDLHSGDLIYMPRGCMHDAVSRDSTSLHLTVGINTITWGSLVLRAVESLIERDARFRESLPPGFSTNEDLRTSAVAQLGKLLAVVGGETEPEPLINDAVQATRLGGQPVLAGHLLDLEATPRVNIRTRVRRRPEVQCRLTVTEDGACLHFYGKTVRFPAYAEPDLRFVAEANEFRVAELPGGLDDAGKVVLAQTLVREGLLTICRHGSLPTR